MIQLIREFPGYAVTSLFIVCVTVYETVAAVARNFGKGKG